MTVFIVYLQALSLRGTIGVSLNQFLAKGKDFQKLLHQSRRLLRFARNDSIYKFLNSPRLNHFTNFKTSSAISRAASGLAN